MLAFRPELARKMPTFTVNDSRAVIALGIQEHEKKRDRYSYDELLPYFKRPEHFDVESDNPYHGNDGELNVTNVAMKYPISEAYIDAAESIGIPRLADINGETQRGISYMQVTMKNGRPAMKGKCPICGTGLYRILSTK